MSNGEANESLADLPETGTGTLHLGLARRLTAEAIGTAFLLLAVVGSGIMAQRLSPSDIGLELLENAAATAAALIGLILMFATVSGAHFNPAVTFVDRVMGTISSRDASLYVSAQVVGAVVGTMLANVIFSLRAVTFSTHVRSSWALWLSEVIATIGLLLVIHGCVRTGRASVVPFAVGIWIGGAYFFTSSTSFANPAAAIGRMFTNSFSGIDPTSVPMFIVAEMIGAVIAIGLIRVLYPNDRSARSDG